MSNSKSFKRMKLTLWAHNSTKLVPRETPLPVIRISSCYSEKKVSQYGLVLAKEQWRLVEVAFKNRS